MKVFSTLVCRYSLIPTSIASFWTKMIYIFKNLYKLNSFWKERTENNKLNKSIALRVSIIAQSVKSLPEMQETQVWFLSWKDPLEQEMATPSSIFVWRIPWTEEPGGLQSMGSQVDTTERLSAHTHIVFIYFPSSLCLLYINFQC